jgi:hypothetical protein
VGGLEGSQDRPDSVYHVLKLDALLLNLVLYVLQVVDQRLQQVLLLLQKLTLRLDLLLLLLRQTESVLQLQEPLVFAGVILAKEVASLRG